MVELAPRSVAATFEVADDILWQAAAGQSDGLPPIAIQRSGLIGPVVEMALAGRALPSAYRGLAFEPPIYRNIAQALDDGAISGSGASDCAGVFPLCRCDPSVGADNTLWNQWMLHAENAAVSAGLNPNLAAGLMGAFGELQDNVFEHSGRPETALVAYGAGNGAFEFVVADSGRGVLATLRENPQFADIADSGAALRIAASDGASRFGQESGRGYGIGQLFRALAQDAAELRFRSGDHALRLWGDAPSLQGQIELGQKAWLDGFVVSVRCTGHAPRQGT